jgi:hypothetical protein
MRSWQTASLIFFVYAAATAYALPEVGTARRRRALFFAALGIVVLILTAALRSWPLLATWVLPPALLLLAYWTSGSLFVAPMPDVERALVAFDRRLGVGGVAAAMPRAGAELLEVAYALVYPLIPVALGLHLLFAGRPDPDRFWMVVLTTDYVCFGMLPWLQTRPPRALESGEPWSAWFRRVNRRLLDRASIHVNTVPSGHAAEAVAAALLVAGAPLPIVLSMAVTALAICAGAVFGRYHYAADVFAGTAVAAAVWLFTR